jgi:fatty acid desaturase
LNLLLKIEGDLPDNSRLTSSIFIGGVWLILIAAFFPQQLGLWREWCVWGGWICVGLAAFLFVRRKIWKWRGKPPKRGSSAISK